MNKGLLLVLSELSDADVERVFVRLAGLRGIHATVADEMRMSDALVEALAVHGGAGALVRAAANPRLTPSQLCLLIEAGGDPVVAGAFPPDADAPDADTGDAGAGDAEAGATPPEGAAGEADHDLDRGRRELRRPGVAAERALALLRAHPVLAHTARRGGPAGVLHTPDAPVTRTEALDQVGPALRAGVLAPREILVRMRPARVAAQVLAVVSREHSYVTGEVTIHELLRPGIVTTLGANPAAWAHLARTLGRFTGTLPELFAAASAHRGETAIEVPAAVRPSVVFLLRRLNTDELTALIPHLDHAAAAALLPGNVPPLPNVAEAALRCGHPALLEALAQHQSIGRHYAGRLKDLGDDHLDGLLVDNRSGVTAELRREIYAGRRADRPRVPMHPDLRAKLIAEPPFGSEPEAYALSGDPALVDHALPQCEARKLRRIDWIDILLSLWERADPSVTGDILDRHGALFPDRIRSTARAALAADDPTPLRELRARWDRGPRAEPPIPEHRRPPIDRIRDTPLEQWHSWLTAAVTAGELDTEEVVRHARPARHAFEALVSIDAYRWAPGNPRPALARLAKRIGANPEAWVVLAGLAADFEGTLGELADLSCAAAG
ncbi:hypothetical protein ACFZBU_01065 [Embleya sp. NPDC008237]|uniref:hypothetical protein n=1 Tax=Embleya sp. NPDC008237 TaxID=3363978 RepID=UPI0036F0DB2C